MWRSQIVARVLRGNNEPRPEGARRHVQTLRPRWLVLRFALFAWAAGSGASVLLGAPVPGPVFALPLVAWGLIEISGVYANRAADAAGFQRRLLLSGLAMSLWAAAFMHFSGAVWFGPLAFALVLSTYASALRRRWVAALTAFSAILFAGEVAGERLGLLPGAERLDAGIVGQFTTPELVGLTAITALAILPGFALISYLTSHRLRQARREVSETAEELDSVLSASQQELARSSELAAKVESQRGELEERNQYLSVVNAVSFALSERMDNHETFERALRLIARLLEMRFAQVHLLPHQTGPATRSVVTADTRDETPSPLPDAVLEQVATTGQPMFSGEADVDAALGSEGDACAVVPLSAKGGALGALALRGQPRGAEWDESERHLILLVAREMGTAVENLHLYQAAVERASRETLINDVARELNAETESADAVPRALSMVAEAVGARLLAVVVRRQGSDEPELAALVVPPAGGDGAAAEVREPGEALRAALGSLAEAAFERTDPLLAGAADATPVPAALMAEGVHAVVAVPLRIARTMSGALLVGAAGPLELGPRERLVVERLAETLGQRLAADALTGLQEKRIRELSGLGQIAGVVQSTVDPERLRSGFARALASLTNYRRLYIVSVDEGGAVREVHRFTADGTAEQAPPVIGADGGHPWFALRRAATWSAHADGAPGFLDATDVEGIVVPLRPKGQALGLAVLVPGGAVNEDLLTLAEQAFGQLALALDSATLYRQATERAARIQVLGNLARIVASAVDLGRAFDEFSEEVRWLIPFESASMMMVDEAQRLAEPYATYPDLHAPLGEAVAAHGPIALARSDPRYTDLDWSMFGTNVTELAAVPVYRGDECVAIFALVRAEEGSYEFEDLVALEEVGRLLAVSIERVCLFEQAEHGARHDLLTGLPNYRYFQERVAGLTPEALQSGLAVMAIDVDDLKLFNDHLGHAAGDQLIRLVARELRASCRADDFVARTGGDEFVLMLSGGELKAAIKLAERVHAALSDMHAEIPGAPTQVRLSIGIATAPEDGSTMTELLDAADQAMYEAKFAGGGSTAIARRSGGETPTRALRRQPNRVVQAVSRAVTAGASEAEREALSLAQRCAVGAAAETVAGTEAGALRMLVAAEVAERLRDRRKSLDGQLAGTLLDGLRAEWLARDADGARTGAELVRASVELAWLQAAEPVGAGLAIEDAIARMRDAGERVPDDAVLSALERVARSEALERRSEEQAA